MATLQNTTTANDKNELYQNLFLVFKNRSVFFMCKKIIFLNYYVYYVPNFD